MSESKGLGLYLRISKDDGTSLAVDRQEAECRAKAQSLGLTITEVYTDQGRSASSKRVVRPEYDRMLADAREGRIGGVITWAHDRLTRQPEQLGDWLALADGGFKLVTVAGELDLSSDSGRLAARIFVAVAEGEVRRKGARQVSANRQRAEQGIPYAKVRAFGYLRGGMELHPVEAPLVAEAVAGLIAGTASVHGTVNAWNRQGILTTRGKAWNRTSLRRVLTSWRICGFLAYQDGAEVFEGEVEAHRHAAGRGAGPGDLRQPEPTEHGQGLLGEEPADPHRPVRHLQQGRGGDEGPDKLAYRCPQCFVSIDRTKADHAVIQAVVDRLAGGYEASSAASTVRAKREELAEIVATGDSLSRMWTAGEISLDQFRLMNEGPSSARKALEAEIQSLVERDALTALVDGLRRSGRFGNTVGNIRANEHTIREPSRLWTSTSSARSSVAWP